MFEITLFVLLIAFMVGLTSLTRKLESQMEAQQAQKVKKAKPQTRGVSTQPRKAKAKPTAKPRKPVAKPAPDYWDTLSTRIARTQAVGGEYVESMFDIPAGYEAYTAEDGTIMLRRIKVAQPQQAQPQQKQGQKQGQKQNRPNPAAVAAAQAALQKQRP